MNSRTAWTITDGGIPRKPYAEIKSLRRFAANMLHTYAGREPGELILKGQIRRGDIRTITAALMLVDLRDFTLISDALAPTNVIKMLNRYLALQQPVGLPPHPARVVEFATRTDAGGFAN
jgi:adenylate cyclase